MRLFVGMPISEQVRRDCVIIQKSLKDTGVRMKLVEPENIHITLKFLGDVPDAKLDAIKEAISDTKSKKIQARTTRVGIFPNMHYIRVVWLGIDSPELIRLHADVNKRLERMGFKREFNFIPHITLARVKSKPNKKLIELIGTEHSRQFIIDRIELIQSKLTEDGPRYDVLYSKELD